MASSLTLKQIAGELGVSVSTVSKALKNSPEISPATRERILEFCRRNNYQPNKLALSLRRRQTRVLGVVVPQIAHYFFSRVVTGIQNRASLAGFQIIIMQSQNERETEQKTIELLANGYVDGLLISLAKESIERQDYRHFQPLITKGFPLVFFDRYPEKLPVTAVAIDDFRAGYRAAMHLIRTGRRHPAVITTPTYLPVGYQRELGFRKALTDNGLEIPASHIIRIDERKAPDPQIEKLFELPHPPDGIFAVNEQYAARALRLAHQYGLQIPGQLGIIGFSDGIIAQNTIPPLTTITQHAFQMGEKAASLLLERLETPGATSPGVHYIETHLIVRGSSRHQGNNQPVQ